MAKRKILEGNVALAEAALRGGCRFFAGYPITPQSSITEYLSTRMAEVGGEFIQAESEVMSVFMVQGASAVGANAMTATSGQGFSLMTEGMSMLNAQEFPAVIVDVERGGAGSCPIKPSQSDYFFATKSIGHGGYKAYVVAPSTVQESVDLAYDAFEFAQKYRCLVLILTDGMQGQIMEAVELPEFKELPAEKPDWVARGNAEGETRRLAFPRLAKEADCVRHEEMYKRWAEEELKYEEYLLDDAEAAVLAWGSAARVAKSAIKALRAEGKRVGMLRPITLHPFPEKQIRALADGQCRHVLVLENSIPAQFYYDVDYALRGTGMPIALYHRGLGNLISPEEAEAELRKLI